MWLRAGVTVQPPWSAEACCPGCGAYHATSFPSGWHPGLRVPAPIPAPDPAPPEGEERLRRPGRLLVAIGAPALAFVAYEIWALYATAARPH